MARVHLHRQSGPHVVDIALGPNYTLGARSESCATSYEGGALQPAFVFSEIGHAASAN